MAPLLIALSLGCSPSEVEESPPTDTNTDTDTDTLTDTGSEDGLIWPETDWSEGEPEDHGYDASLLDAVREYAFTKQHNTQAVVIIKDGVLIAEWYAEDADRDTPVTSWSAAKSVTSALFGVAIREQLLSLDDPIGAHVTEWSDAAYDNITIRNMLYMESGLEENTSNHYGVYGSSNQLAYSLARTPSWEPGVAYNYVNEDSMVLGGALSAAFGKEVGQVAEEEIFAPIGMNATWWTDTAGSTLTYCCIDSTARDFARFGLLFARNGMWQGQQLIPEDFVAESTEGVAFHGYYGLHWWDYGTPFAAIGYHGQFVFVYPEEDLVITRFGRYLQVGDEPVRDSSWENYQSTEDSGPFDEMQFLDLIEDAMLPK